jgi:hypothetical protein
MVVNNGFDFNNSVSYYIIQDGYITPAPVPGTCAIEHKPKQIISQSLGSINEDPVFMDFISIDVNKQSEILKFVNKYGLLQLNYYDGLEGKAFYESYVEKEPVSAYIYEIELMRTIVDLKQSMDELDYSKMKVNLKKLYKYIPEYEFEDKSPYITDFDKDIDNNNLMLCSGSAISLCINKRMKFINPMMIYANTFTGHWSVSSLINAMYFELFLSFSQDTKYKKCQNSSCPRYFKITRADKRKIYCNNECAKLEWQRRNRASKKAKEAELHG